MVCRIVAYTRDHHQLWLASFSLNGILQKFDSFCIEKAMEGGVCLPSHITMPSFYRCRWMYHWERWLRPERYMHKQARILQMWLWCRLYWKRNTLWRYEFWWLECVITACVNCLYQSFWLVDKAIAKMKLKLLWNFWIVAKVYSDISYIIFGTLIMMLFATAIWLTLSFKQVTHILSKHREVNSQWQRKYALSFITEGLIARNGMQELQANLTPAALEASVARNGVHCINMLII